MPPRNPRPRNYICPECNKDFSTSSKLRTHSYTHSGVRPFSCFVCNVSFNQKPNLKRHLRVQHEFEDSRINELINQTHQIRCIRPECQITFQKDNDLKRHLRMDHFLEESQIEAVLIENYIVHPIPIMWKLSISNFDICPKPIHDLINSAKMLGILESSVLKVWNGSVGF